MTWRITIFLLLFFTFSFLFRTDYSFDQDLGRHIKLGGIILQIHQIPKTNLFSYTNPDFPFINTHWLFEAVSFLFAQANALQLLLILKFIIFLLSVCITLKLIPKDKTVLLLPIGFIFLHVLRERLELRPEIFSFLFTTLTYYILEKYLKKPTKLIYLLPLIQLIWIDTHIYFFVGLGLQVIFIITHRKLRTLWLIFGLSLIFSLLNPNGLEGLLYPLNVNQNYGYTIVENQTLFFLENLKFADPNFLFVKLSWVIIILSLTSSFIKRRFEVKNILLCVFGMGLSILNVRSFPYLVFLSLPAVLINFGTVKKNGVTFLLLLVTCALLLLESFFYLNGDYYKYADTQKQVGLSFGEPGKNSLDFVLANKLPQPIFNNFDIGSYIIYKGFPSYKVFVDGRPEAYPKEFFTNTYIPIQYDFNKFKDLDKQINFKTIIFSHTDQTPWGVNFLQNIVKDPDWKCVYIDQFMIVLVKKETLGNLPSLDLNKLDPSSYSFNNHADYLRLGYFLIRTNNLNSGKLFLDKVIQIFPESPTANAILFGTSSNNFFW